MLGLTQNIFRFYLGTSLTVLYPNFTKVIQKSVSSPHLSIYDHHVGDFPSSEQLPGGRRQLHGLPEGWDQVLLGVFCLPNTN